MKESAAKASTTVDLTEREELVYHVVETVAEEEGVDPLDLEPLSTVIDADALEALFRPQLSVGAVPNPASEVRFEYHGYEVCVNAVGCVSLNEA